MKTLAMAQNELLTEIERVLGSPLQIVHAPYKTIYERAEYELHQEIEKTNKYLKCLEKLREDVRSKRKGFTCIEHSDYGKEKCKVQCPYCEKI